MSAPPEMDPGLFRPFVEETARVFRKMLGISIRETVAEKKEAGDGTFQVSAFVGISGSCAGGLVLSSPEDASCRMISRMIGEPLGTLDRDVTDGFGELVNIVAGSACGRLSEQGFRDLSLSLPTVVVGQHRVVWHSRDLPCLMMRFFDSEIGPFSMEVSLRPSPGARSL